MREGLLWLLRDTRRARRRGLPAIEHRQRARLAEMVAFARAGSPYYRELYHHLPPRIEEPTLVPVTSKEKLMARFDDWATDREVTIAKACAFAADSDLIGERFLDKYTLATTSGTTGTRGIFLMDDRSMAVTAALFLRMMSAWLSVGDVIRILAGRGRLAMVNAMGGHFASAVAATRLRNRRRGRGIRVLPVDTALAELVAPLNRFRPVILVSYASMALLLAGEQERGRLRINPVLVVLSAEGLRATEYDRIARAFNAKVRDSYAASECPFLSYRCEHGWLHVNSDWVVLEPVDADYRPVRPGEQSHTVLISNLANRVQPIIRYDLGDRILQRPDPCPCRNALPAIRVEGRSADVLTFRTEHAERVSIPPLAFELDHIPGVELIQIVQTSPTSVRVRLRLAAGADPRRAWKTVHAEIMHLLVGRQLEHVAVERAEEAPEQCPGGKYRAVIPLS